MKTENKDESFNKLTPKQKISSSKQIMSISTNSFIIIIATCHGLYSICKLASFLYMKDTLKISPELIQIFLEIIKFPWDFKPISGFIIDYLRVRIIYIKYVIFCTSIIQILLISTLPIYQPTIIGLIFILFLISFCQVLENVICEFLLVIETQSINVQKDQNFLANKLPLYYGVRIVGAIFGLFMGGRLIQNYSLFYPFYIYQFCPLLQIFGFFLYNEVPLDENQISELKTKSWMDEMRMIIEIFHNNKVIKFIIVVIALCMIPSLDQGNYFFYIKELKMNLIQLANLDTFSMLFYLIAILLYSFYYIKFNPKNQFIIMNVFLLFFSYFYIFIFLRIPEKYGYQSTTLVFLGSEITSLFYELTYMPLLAIVCIYCPPGIEASYITIFTCLMNLTSSIAAFLGSIMMNFLDITSDNQDNLWKGYIITNFLQTIVLIILIYTDFPDYETQRLLIKERQKSKRDIVLELKTEGEQIVFIILNYLRGFP